MARNRNRSTPSAQVSFDLAGWEAWKAVQDRLDDELGQRIAWFDWRAYRLALVEWYSRNPPGRTLPAPGR